MISPDEGIYAGYVIIIYAALGMLMFLKSERSK